MAQKYQCVIDQEAIEAADALAALFITNPDQFDSSSGDVSVDAVFGMLDGSESSIEYVYEDKNTEPQST